MLVFVILLSELVNRSHDEKLLRRGTGMGAPVKIELLFVVL